MNTPFPRTKNFRYWAHTSFGNVQLDLNKKKKMTEQSTESAELEAVSKISETVAREQHWSVANTTITREQARELLNAQLARAERLLAELNVSARKALAGPQGHDVFLVMADLLYGANSRISRITGSDCHGRNSIENRPPVSQPPNVWSTREDR